MDKSVDLPGQIDDDDGDLASDANIQNSSFEVRPLSLPAEPIWKYISQRQLADMKKMMEEMQKGMEAKLEQAIENERKKSEQKMEAKLEQAIEDERKKSEQDIEDERKKSEQEMEKMEAKLEQVIENERKKSEQEIEDERKKSEQEMEKMEAKLEQVIEDERKKSEQEMETMRKTMNAENAKLAAESRRLESELDAVKETANDTAEWIATGVCLPASFLFSFLYSPYS